MTTTVQWRRGTATEHASFVGALGEITVDTTNKTLRVHDGATPGGTRLASFADIGGQNNSLAGLSQSLTDEITRANNAESGLITSLANEVTRAQAAEALLATKANPTFVGTVTADIVNSKNGNVHNNVGRNRLINASFAVNQRNATTVTVAGDWPVDRWQYSGSSIGATSVASAPCTDNERSAMGDEEITRILTITTNGNGGTNDYEYVQQKIEGVRTFAGKTVTFSIWAVSATPNKVMAVELNQFFGTGGTPSSPVVGIGSTKLTLSTTWTRYQVTVPVPTTVGKTLGTAGNDHLALVLWTSAGATYAGRTGALGPQNSVISIAAPQIELGTVATAVEHKPLVTELAQCQRYLEVSQFILMGYGASGALYGNTITFNTPKRAIPSILTLSNGVPANSGGLTYDVATVSGFRAYASVTNTGNAFINGCSLLAFAEL